MSTSSPRPSTPNRWMLPALACVALIGIGWTSFQVVTTSGLGEWHRNKRGDKRGKPSRFALAHDGMNKHLYGLKERAQMARWLRQEAPRRAFYRSLYPLFLMRCFSCHGRTQRPKGATEMMRYAQMQPFLTRTRLDRAGALHMLRPLTSLIGLFWLLAGLVLLAGRSSRFLQVSILILPVVFLALMFSSLWASASVGLGLYVGGFVLLGGGALLGVVRVFRMCLADERVENVV